MPKDFDIKRLDKVCLVGVGLLGGSIGLALRAAGFGGTRVGVGRRQSSLDRAIECDAVDEVSLDVSAGVKGCQLVIVCTPIGRMEALILEMADALDAGTMVTDVASTKADVVRMAERLLPDRVRFVGSHPMAGSEKTGVDFARADLFERALCLVTPGRSTPEDDTRWVRQFWEALGGHSLIVSPAKHDRLLARVSHLPHAVASALVSLATKQSAIELAGPGFADTTRVASGNPSMWTDILRTNRKAMIQAIDQLTEELGKLRANLEEDDADAICRWLGKAQEARDQWISRRYEKKVLPP
jgi:prephenate dehydrogenase